MGKGSSSKAYSTPLAPWVSGAHQRLISEAEREAYGTPYQPFEGERVSDFTPEEQAGFQARQEMFEGGGPYADYAAEMLQYSAGLPGQLGDVSSQYQASEFGKFDPSTFGDFNEAARDRYMSPYMSAVTDFEKDAAREEFARQRMASDAERVASGARGGYREALQNYFGGAEEASRIAEIEARGRQRAFENAQQQFQRDRAAAIEAARMGDTSAFRASQEAMRADLANQKRVMDSARLGGEFAQRAMDFGTAGQKREIERIRAMEQAGATQREMQQRILNMAVQDFEAQRDYPWTQMNRLQSIIAGTPANIAGTMTSQAPPTLASQLLGLGLGYAGIKDLLG